MTETTPNLAEEKLRNEFLQDYTLLEEREEAIRSQKLMTMSHNVDHIFISKKLKEIGENEYGNICFRVYRYIKSFSDKIFDTDMVETMYSELMQGISRIPT